MRTAALLTGSLLLAASVRASPGEEPFAFLSADAGARAAALGGAYTALARDSGAPLYNPGGLGRIERNEASFMHGEHFAGVTQEHASFALRGGFGGSLDHVGYGSMPRTTVSRPDGTGDFGASDLAVSGAWGRRVGGSLGLGAGLKFIREAIDDAAAAGFAADFGALYSVEEYPGLDLGLAVRNLGPSVRFEGESESLPLDLRAGAAYSYTAWGQPSLFALDFSRELSEEVAAALGAETTLAKALALRLGFNTRNAAGYGVTLGLGWTLQGVSVDYVFVPYGELGDSHRFSLTCRWGAPAARTLPAPASAAPPPPPPEKPIERPARRREAAPAGKRLIEVTE